MAFRSTPILSVGNYAGDWELVRPLVWESAGETIVVPAGFRTDLASIPRLFHWLIPVNGRHRAAAILHDYLFVIQDRSRTDVDTLFLWAMAASGVRWTQRTTMYAAVRAGGWLPWRRNARALARDRAGFLRSYGLESVPDSPLGAHAAAS